MPRPKPRPEETTATTTSTRSSRPAAMTTAASRILAWKTAPPPTRGLTPPPCGMEAEARALKTAVGDAEKRVGEGAEELREARGRAELLADEREEWERRGREMEGVLRQVKEEIVRGGRERDEMEAKLDEADKRCAAAEMMAQEAESKMAGMRAGAVAAAAAAGASSPGGKVRSPGGESSASTQ